MDIQTKTAPVTDLGDGEFQVLLSTPHRDRDGENLHTEEWKAPLPPHVPFSCDHDMSTAGVVGSGTPTLTGRGLEVRGVWADTERAQHVRGLVSSGHIRHVSVEFLRHADAKSGAVERELIGGSFVYTPSNPNAKVLASKGILDILDEQLGLKAGARNSAADSQLLQAVHDASVLLGASCVPTSEPEPDADDGSSEGANRALAAAVEAKAALLRIRLG
jgi:hypothetical protein